MDRISEKKLLEEQEILDDILAYGRDILRSEVFRQGASEAHHVHGTVFDHTVNVCVVALKLARRQAERGVPINKKDLVQAALCHDLGMVSRKSKYRNQIDTCRNHPLESARIASELLPDLSPEAEEMIRSHMWPLGGSMPTTKEGTLLVKADKYASMADWKTWLTGKRYAERIKARLEAEEERGRKAAGEEKQDE